jgi:hypothetical protein
LPRFLPLILTKLLQNRTLKIKRFRNTSQGSLHTFHKTTIIHFRNDLDLKNSCYNQNGLSIRVELQAISSWFPWHEREERYDILNALPAEATNSALDHQV